MFGLKKRPKAPCKTMVETARELCSRTTCKNCKKSWNSFEWKAKSNFCVNCGNKDDWKHVLIYRRKVFYEWWSCQGWVVTKKEYILHEGVRCEYCRGPRPGKRCSNCGAIAQE